jgi:hypothetical protein
LGSGFGQPGSYRYRGPDCALRCQRNVHNEYAKNDRDDDRSGSHQLLNAHNSPSRQLAAVFKVM